MIITTTYTAESKKDEKALRYMAMTMQDSGLDAILQEPPIPSDPLLLLVKESRRARKGKDAAPVSEERERIQREAVAASK